MPAPVDLVHACSASMSASTRPLVPGLNIPHSSDQRLSLVNVLTGSSVSAHSTSGSRSQLRERLGAGALGHRDDLGVGQAQRALERDVGVRADVRALRGVEAGDVVHDDPRVVGTGGRGREGERDDREGGGAGQAHPDRVRQPDTRSPSRPSGSWPRVLPQRS